jgi:hypothetical protein
MEAIHTEKEQDQRVAAKLFDWNAIYQRMWASQIQIIGKEAQNLAFPVAESRSLINNNRAKLFIAGSDDESAL